METSAAYDGPGFSETGSEIRKALAIRNHSQIQRFTENPEPLCRNQTNLFFGVTTYDAKGEEIAEKSHQRIGRELTAIEICAVCPYRLQCLAKKLTESQDDDRWGVQGGYNVLGRRRLRAWLHRQGVEHLVMGPELIWNIRFYEGAEAIENPLQYLKKRLFR